MFDKLRYHCTDRVQTARHHCKDKGQIVQPETELQCSSSVRIFPLCSAAKDVTYAQETPQQAF